MFPSFAKPRLFFGLLLLVLVSACQQAGTSALSPTGTIRVEISTSLRYLSPAIQACNLTDSEFQIILEETPASGMGKTGADVSLRLGDKGIAETLLVYRLGSDRLVLAAHKDNPIKELNVDQASLLIRGGMKHWRDIINQFCSECAAPETFLDRSLVSWKYPPAEDIAMEINRIPSIDQSVAINRIHVAPNPSALAAALAYDPGAIGWLPARWLNSNLKEITLTGSNPLDYVIPVVALTPVEPSAAVSTWLECLQSTYNN